MILKAELEPMSMMYGVRGKGGKPVEIGSRGNIATKTSPTGGAKDLRQR